MSDAIEYLSYIDEIKQKFPFFPRLHAILATRPNATPIAVTTGVGPSGRQTLYLQPPSQDAETVADQPLEPFEPFIDHPANPVTVSTPPQAPEPSRAFGTPRTNQQPLQKAPHSSTLSQTAIDKARATVKKVPQKRSFEDEIISLQKYVLLIKLVAMY